MSLLPAATEICFALGLGPDVVGVSPECDHPPAARTRPVVSRSTLDEEGRPSAETSRLVGERIAAGDPLYSVDEGALRALAPDVVLTQALCDVCAPSLQDVRAVADRLPDPPHVVSLDPHRLDDILGDIVRVGDVCGVHDAALSFVDGMRARIERVSSRTASVATRPRTLCLEWLDPFLVAGHWVPELVALAGGEDVLGRVGARSYRIEPRDIAIAAPDLAVLMPCGFHLDRAMKESSGLARMPFWRDMPAARRDRVWVVDGSSYFSRPGPRVVDGLEVLAHLVHPRLFPTPARPNAARPWAG
ncbi:MAG: cobalamin-binding protein [Methanobacteriota archaeon]